MIQEPSEFYEKKPIAYEDGIPVFSKSDYYVKNYERISTDHLDHFEKTGHNPFMREDYWREVENTTGALIKKYAISENTKILDVGVGMGRLLERVPEFQRFGMDISKGYLKYAKSKGIHVCMSRIEDMPYKENFFDICVTTDVLEHVLDLNLAVSKILSVLKEGGILIVRVPFKEDLKGYLQEDYPYDLVHLRNFDEYNLRMLFEKIFNIDVLEWNLTGFIGGRLKIGADIRYYSGLMSRFVDLTSKINGEIHKTLSRIMNNPIEINMVIKKSNRSDLER